MSPSPADVALTRLPCPWCGELIGIYEPLVIVLRSGETVRTSLVVSPRAGSRGLALHAGCYGTLPQD